MEVSEKIEVHDENENPNPVGFSFSAHANDAYELRDILSRAADRLIEMHDRLNSGIFQHERDMAFIRYCNTGRFE